MKIKQAKNRVVKCLAVLGMAGLCLPALAQDNEQVESGEPAPVAEDGTQRAPVKVFAGGSHQFNTDIDNGGDFSLTRFRTGIEAPMQFQDRWTLTPTVKYELSSYDFGGGGNPWHNINTLSCVALLQYRLDEHWLLYGGPVMRFSAESGVNLGDGAQGGGLIAASYIVDETLTIGGGLFATSQIEEDAMVIPVITAKWKFAENWKLNLGFTDLATTGYGVAVAWDCCPKWQLTFGGQFHKSRFRIEGSGLSKDGVGQEKALALTVAATWTPCKSFSGTAFLGIAAGGEIRVEDNSGKKLGQEDYDATPILGLNATLRF